MKETFDNLHSASERGDIAAVKALLTTSHDLNVFDEISFTPLHYAARGGHLVIIRLLLQAGANVNARDEPRIGDTPLASVAGNCSFAVAESLISAGADPTIRGWMQLCALDRAENRKAEEGRRVYELLCSAARKFNGAAQNNRR
jgi:ankyrin repeat protein